VLLIAAVLLVVLGIAHSFLGERFILVRLFKRGKLPKLLGSDSFTQGTLRFAWHLTTVAWVGFAAILVSVRTTGQVDTVHALYMVSVVSVLSAVLAAWFTRGRHLSWIVFLAVAGLSAAAA
jgi:hypothetical protein